MRRPRRPVEIDWPDAVRVDGGLVGGGRLAWPQGASEDELPEWMVFGAMIRTVSMGEGEPGLNPLVAALEEEGFTDLTAGALVESFARHLMVHTDAWQEHGFGAVAKEYLQRMPRESGLRRDIDENGDLLLRRTGKVEVERKTLLPLLGRAVVARSENARAARVKLLRTIQLDPSDTFVFERAAEPGEWAVSGAFAFWNTDAAKLEGKARSAFRGAFLGVESLGWSTLVQIVEASEADRAAVVERLAQQLVAHFGAPDIGAARAAAEEEVAFAASLVQSPGRYADRGASHASRMARCARRSARCIRAADKKPMRAFSFLEVEGEEEPGDEVDLVALAESKTRAAMKDFWLSCGHHLLDRDAGGGLVVTDEFLKVYLARPELRRRRMPAWSRRRCMPR